MDDLLLKKMVRDSKKSTYAVTLETIVMVFLCHGILYFTPKYSDGYYSYDNPIKVIKYVVLFIALLVTIINRRLIKPKELAPFFIATLLIVSNYVSVKNKEDYFVLLNYCAPVFVLFFYEHLKKYVNLYKVVCFTYVFSSVVGYIEFFFLRGKFAYFSDYGYRVCSIFINPNNFAAFIFVSTTIIITRATSEINKVIVLINSYLLLGMTGSRSGLVMMSLSLLLILGYSIIRLIRRNELRIGKEKGFMLISILAIFIVLVLNPYIIIKKVSSILEGGRRIGSIDLTIGRFSQIRSFLEQVKNNPVFPWENQTVYTDNLFLHIWGFWGLYMLIAYITLTTYVVNRLWRIEKEKSLLLALLFLYGVFENFLYLWPISYIYWYLIGTGLFHNRYSGSCFVSKVL